MMKAKKIQKSNSLNSQSSKPFFSIEKRENNTYQTDKGDRPFFRNSSQDFRFEGLGHKQNQVKNTLGNKSESTVQLKESNPIINRQVTDQGPTRQELEALNDAYDQAMGTSGRNRILHLRAQLEYFRQLRQLIQDRQPIENRRLLIDQYSIIQAAMEPTLVNSIDQNAINIVVTPIDIAININIQVYFENQNRSTTEYSTLVRNFELGVNQIWSRRLSGFPSLVQGRRFRIIPNLQLSNSRDRNPNNFQIFISSSVSRANTVNNVMSISPSDLRNPNTLGHESLHFFGLSDRYVDIFNNNTGQSQSVPGRGIDPVEAERNMRTGTPSNATGVTRNDPLDTGTGPILNEDLDFVFANVGVYEQTILSNLSSEQNVLIQRMGRGYIRTINELNQEAEQRRSSFPRLDRQQILNALISEKMNRINRDLRSASDREQLREDTAFDLD